MRLPFLCVTFFVVELSLARESLPQEAFLSLLPNDAPEISQEANTLEVEENDSSNLFVDEPNSDEVESLLEPVQDLDSAELLEPLADALGAEEPTKDDPLKIVDEFSIDTGEKEESILTINDSITSQSEGTEPSRDLDSLF